MGVETLIYYLHCGPYSVTLFQGPSTPATCRRDENSFDVVANKKPVLSQRRPHNALTKVNKQPQLGIRSRDSRLTQCNRTLWT